MKKYLLPIAATTLLLTGCAGPEEPIASTTETTSATVPSSTASSSIAHHSSTTRSSPSTTELKPAQEPAPIEQNTPDDQVAPVEIAEPYVVECLFGTPGPSLMSDGTTIHTDYCFYKNGGPEYLQQESWANSPDNPALAEKYAEEERLANIPYADGGTCPAYKCGYGTNSQGEPNPSSGELQAFHGCQAGYIDDPELCDAVAWVEHHEY